MHVCTRRMGLWVDMLSNLDLGTMLLLKKLCRHGQVCVMIVLCALIGIHLDAGGLQIGGGINDRNAQEWLDAGASKVRIYQASKPSYGLCVIGHRDVLPLPWCKILSRTIEEDFCCGWERQACCRCEVEIKIGRSATAFTTDFLAADDVMTNGLLLWTSGKTSPTWRWQKVCIPSLVIQAFADWPDEQNLWVSCLHSAGYVLNGFRFCLYLTICTANFSYMLPM